MVSTATPLSNIERRSSPRTQTPSSDPDPSPRSNESQSRSPSPARSQTRPEQTPSASSPSPPSSVPNSDCSKRWGLGFGSNRMNLTIILFSLGLAVASYLAQLQSNSLAEEANRLAQVGNGIAAESYKLGVWQECMDRPELRNTSQCLSVLRNSTQQPVRRLEHPKAERRASLSSLPTGRNRSHQATGNLTQRLTDLSDAIDRKLTNVRGTFIVWLNKAHIWFHNTFVTLLCCHVLYLFLLRELLTLEQQRRPQKHFPFLEYRRPISSYSYRFAKRAKPLQSALAGLVGLWMSCAIFGMVYAASRGIPPDVSTDFANGLALMVLLVAFVMLERDVNLIREQLKLRRREEDVTSEVAEVEPEGVFEVFVFEAFRCLGLAPLS